MITFLIYGLPHLIFTDLERIRHMADESSDQNAVLFVAHFARIKVSLNVPVILKDDD